MPFPLRILGPPTLALALGACAAAPDAQSSTARRIADAYGEPAFGQVDGLRYTFHARLGDREVRRHWEWEPATGRVAHRAGDDEGTIIYFRGPDGPPESARDVDAAFINDQYWLLFPLHLVWDEGLTVTSEGAVPSPIAGRTADKVVAAYGSELGYTPGDAYDLWVTPDGTVLEWVFRQGGAPEPTRTAAWAEPTDVGPIRASLSFEGPDPAVFRIWFTDVEVRADGGEWTAVE